MGGRVGHQGAGLVSKSKRHIICLKGGVWWWYHHAVGVTKSHWNVEGVVLPPGAILISGEQLSHASARAWSAAKISAGGQKVVGGWSCNRVVTRWSRSPHERGAKVDQASPEAARKFTAGNHPNLKWGATGDRRATRSRKRTRFGDHR
eukprot:scaffold1312_cov264-Pinguiococcus_pyrenoidosus.AAC.5